MNLLQQAMKASDLRSCHCFDPSKDSGFHFGRINDGLDLQGPGSLKTGQ